MFNDYIVYQDVVKHDKKTNSKLYTHVKQRNIKIYFSTYRFFSIKNMKEIDIKLY